MNRKCSGARIAVCVYVLSEENIQSHDNQATTLLTCVPVPVAVLDADAVPEAVPVPAPTPPEPVVELAVCPAVKLLGTYGTPFIMAWTDKPSPVLIQSSCGTPPCQLGTHAQIDNTCTYQDEVGWPAV